ncbi:MAG: hypothetical protein ACXWG0_08200 [Chthoniobacterales bacterium]
MTTTMKLWLALALVVVFFAGAAAGLFGGAIYAHHMFVGRHGGFVAHRMREHLRRELQLTPEQNGKIAPILDRLDQRLETIRNETAQRVTETMNESHAEIVPLLTPEQREKFDQMRERHRHILHLHGGAPPPPPGGP